MYITFGNFFCSISQYCKRQEQCRPGNSYFILQIFSSNLQPTRLPNLQQLLRLCKSFKIHLSLESHHVRSRIVSGRENVRYTERGRKIHKGDGQKAKFREVAGQNTQDWMEVMFLLIWRWPLFIVGTEHCGKRHVSDPRPDHIPSILCPASQHFPAPAEHIMFFVGKI